MYHYPYPACLIPDYAGTMKLTPSQVAAKLNISTTQLRENLANNIVSNETWAAVYSVPQNRENDIWTLPAYELEQYYPKDYLPDDHHTAIGRNVIANLQRLNITPAQLGIKLQLSYYSIHNIFTRLYSYSPYGEYSQAILKEAGLHYDVYFD